MTITKRILSGILALGILCSVFGMPVLADGVEEDVVAAQSVGDIPAKSYVLMEASSGKVLMEQNADEQMPPASITKIMVMLLLMERLEQGTIHMEDMVTTSEHANSMGGTQIWLEVGETMSVHDLLKATAVNSANDAAVALAEYMGGTEEAFVEQMNQRAKELGMNNTTFKNATGLDADGHLSTARDVAIMSAELIKHEKIKEYSSIWMDSLRDGKTGLTNTNKLVRYYEGCNGLKTGTTDGAGSCLSATATRNGMTLIAVTMGSATSKERFKSASTLLDYGFASYEVYTPDLSQQEIPEIPVSNGQQSVVEIGLPSTVSMVISKGDQANITSEVTVTENLRAPVQQGQEVGKITYYLNGDILAEYPIYAKNQINQLDFPFVFLKLLLKLIS